MKSLLEPILTLEPMKFNHICELQELCKNEFYTYFFDVSHKKGTWTVKVEFKVNVDSYIKMCDALDKMTKNKLEV